ncbi:MAG: ShlB/FhaC/HecB family hemolysin secretion/activation protein [Alphaproteobacteria bacterium]|nr:ShlB/FhaC/HecB family hemolysin secretion/activation protein [Alphaproteobacteria bacterium]
MLHGVKRIGMLAALLLGLLPTAAMSQSQADRADPSHMRQEMREPPAAPPPARQPLRLQQGQAGESGAVGTLLVGAVHVDGAVAIPPSAFGPAIEPFLGRQLGPPELRDLATAIANVARQAGYGLATAQVPQQTIREGILRVVVDEGRIDAVEPSGSGADAVRPLLQRLVNGRPVRTAELERQLLLAGDVAGVSTDGARIDRVGDRNILRLQARRNRIAVRAGLDNWGSSPIGPLRARLDIDVNGALLANDQLSIGGLITPAQPREFQFVRAAWSVPLGHGGTQVSLSGYYGHSRPGAALKSRNLEGKTAGGSLTLSQPLLRSRSASLWASGDFSLLDSSLDEQGILIRRDRVRTATAGLNGVSRVGGGWIRAGLSVVQGVSGLGATRRGDPLASRSDAGGAFTKLAFSAQYATALAGRLSLNLATEGQLASRPLLSSEEMGLGGRSFLRGYDYWEVAGDQGASASAELRYDIGAHLPGIRRLQLYAYGDAGSVRNLKGGTGGGTLASAGGGVRATLRNGAEAGIELGVPLKASPYTPSPKPRVSFTLAFPF